MTEEHLFEQALPLSPAERDALLDRECGNNPKLRRRIEALLAADARPNLTIDSPINHTGSYSTPSEAAGTIIAGKYKLIEEIGEGGMGSVYMAQQTEPVKRAVAVKVIKAGMDTKAVLARFEAERQALAMMDHPNIARVLDAGSTESGRPFFVMELVKGTPITQYCDERKLTTRQRLELFVPVCQAIQHAHQKGIIHRDIKPSNVLVAMYDDRPVPKVIDFGVAKAAGNTLTDKTLMTGFGAVVGTPEYMSPEQANLNNMDIDTRSDVYSLGVLLYELLTGTTPVDKKSLGKAALLEVLRIVREVEAPKPSAKLSTIDTLPSVAANRGTEPAKLSKLMKGELDWLVLKALEKDRTRRYDTANGLAKDIQRYLTGDAVEACPPTLGYRLQKAYRKNRAAVRVASAFVCLAFGAAAMGVYLAVRATNAERVAEAERDNALTAQRKEAERADAEARERQRADEEKKRAIKFRDQALDALRATTGKDVEKLIGEKTELSQSERDYLEAIAKRWQGFANQSVTDAESRSYQAEGHHRVASLWRRLGRYDDARTKLLLALDLQKKLVEQYPEVREYQHALGITHDEMARILKVLGQREAAHREHLAALTILKMLVTQYSGVAAYQHELAATHANLGSLLRDLGKLEAAREQFQLGFALRKKLVEQYPDELSYRSGLAHNHLIMGNVLTDLGQLAAAGVEYHFARDINKKLLEQFPAVLFLQVDLADTLSSLGTHYSRVGQHEAAMQQTLAARTMRKTLADRYPAVPKHQRDLFWTQIALGLEFARLLQWEAARTEYQAAQDRMKMLVEQYPAVPEYQENLAAAYQVIGRLLRDTGQSDEAIASIQAACDLRKKLAEQFATVPAYQEALARTYTTLGAVHGDLKQLEEAKAAYESALRLRKKLFDLYPAKPDHQSGLAMGHYNLGLFLAQAGQLEAARAEYMSARDLQKKLVEQYPEPPEYQRILATTHSNLGNLFRSLKQFEEARSEHKAALALRKNLAERFPGETGHQVSLGGSYCNLGNLILEHDGKPAESLDWFDRAIQTLGPAHEKKPRDRLAKEYLKTCHSQRAEANERLKSWAEAIKDWDRAVELSPPSQQPEYRARRANSLQKAGKVAEAVAEVAELTKSSNWTAVRWYDFACVYAVASAKFADKKQEYADRAMELLHKNVQAGDNDAAFMKKDTDLDALREREDFKKLIAELEKGAKPEKSP